MKPEILALLDKLDEDAAKAKKEDAQVWRALHHGICPECGRKVKKSTVQEGFWIFATFPDVWTCPVHGEIRRVEYTASLP